MHARDDVTEIDVRGLTVDALIEFADDGNQQAAEELDRRGVEPPILEPDGIDLPNASNGSDGPDPLRATAAALREVERELHATADALERYASHVPATPRVMAALAVAGGALLELADELDRAGES
jgi:hypothetical protein